MNEIALFRFPQKNWPLVDLIDNKIFGTFKFEILKIKTVFTGEKFTKKTISGTVWYCIMSKFSYEKLREKLTLHKMFWNSRNLR